MLAPFILTSTLRLSEAVSAFLQATLVVLAGVGLSTQQAPATAGGKSAAAAAERGACAPQEPSLLKCAGEHGATAFLARLEALLGEDGRDVPEELLDVVRAALQSRGLRPSIRLGELLLQGYLALDLRDEFDEVYMDMCPGGVVPSMKVLALRRMW